MLCSQTRSLKRTALKFISPGAFDGRDLILSSGYLPVALATLNSATVRVALSKPTLSPTLNLCTFLSLPNWAGLFYSLSLFLIFTIILAESILNPCLQIPSVKIIRLLFLKFPQIFRPWTEWKAARFFIRMCQDHIVRDSVSVLIFQGSTRLVH